MSKRAATVAVTCAALIPAAGGAHAQTVNAAPSSPEATVQQARWPKLEPQGGRWKKDGTRTREDYYRTDPPQGGAKDRDSGSTRFYAIKVWQELLTERGYRVNAVGVYGPKTESAVLRFQKGYNRSVPPAYRLGTDGRVNYLTARALLAPTIKRFAQRYDVPAEILCGHLNAESSLDARAVGPEGSDYGLAQMSARFHQNDYTLAEAFDEDVAIAYMARRDRAARRTYGSYKIGVVAYWSPAAARAWKKTGKPSRAAKAYSLRVKRGCDGYEFRG
ncbi:MAG: peptidoglycan-binding protein [Catenulispora sp.]